MELHTEHLDSSTLLLKIVGRFDAHTTDQVKTAWVNDPTAGSILVDLSETTFIDSTALATLVSGMKTATGRGGAFAVINPATVVTVIFELTRMDKVFQIAPLADDVKRTNTAPVSRVLSMPARLDAGSAPAFRQAIQNAVKESVKILLIDGSTASFIDSTGLAALVGGHKTFNGIQGGRFVITGVNGTAREIFNLTRMDLVFTMYPSLDEAKSALHLQNVAHS